MADPSISESRFAFGENWRSYASHLSESQIDEAVSGLRRLLRLDSLQGKTLLDIGCGSGIHTLAALRMGAAHVAAIDFDADCVATTKRLLDQHAPTGRADVRQGSILDIDAAKYPKFDIVYSWGVLHHTGRMHAAIERAASLVKDGGLFAFALYRKTWCCSLWKIEKRWYVGTGARFRRVAESGYVGLVRLGLLFRAQSFRDYVTTYPMGNRGMSFYHDVRDWLGGYPYESISPDEVDDLMRRRGFSQVARYVRRDLLSRSGLLGSGCDEFLYGRVEETIDHAEKVV